MHVHTHTLCDPVFRDLEGAHVHLKLLLSSLWNINSTFLICTMSQLGKQGNYYSDSSVYQPPVVPHINAGESLLLNWLLSHLKCPRLNLGTGNFSLCDSILREKGRKAGRTKLSSFLLVT